MIYIDKCICGSMQHHNLMKHDIFVKHGEIVQCDECGFIWSKKQLDDIELESFYKYKYRDLKGEILDFTRFRNDLQRAISQYSFYNDSLADLDQVILEIGAGWGVSSKYLYKKGFNNIYIIEPDARVNNILPKDIKILNNMSEAPSKKISLVIMSHVLEHIFNVKNFLRRLATQMNKDSVVFVEVPNCENQKVLMQSDESYHYWFFTKKSLINLFKSQGFEPVKVQTYGKGKFSKIKSTSKSDNIIREYESSRDEAYWLRGSFKVFSQ